MRCFVYRATGDEGCGVQTEAEYEAIYGKPLPPGPGGMVGGPVLDLDEALVERWQKVIAEYEKVQVEIGETIAEAYRKMR